MKQRLVQQITQSGNNLGQVSHPNDLMKAQEYVHQHINDLTRDFLNTNRQIAGFPYTLGAGNAFTITINKSGRVYDADGLSYELLANTTLNIAAAHSTLPRLDLVVAVLDDEVESELNLIPFVRLRTPEEFSENVEPYPPQNLNAPTELHWRAVAQIKTGTPAAVPTAPALASNEVPLYLIAVAPGAAAIRNADVLDMREAILTLQKLNELNNQNKIDLSKLTRRVIAVEKISSQPIDLSQVFGAVRSLGDILAAHERQLFSLREMPDVRHAIPKIPLTDHNSSKIPATGGSASSIPYVDIEVGGRINFGDTEVAILPQNFKDAVQARYAQVAPTPSNVKTETDLILNNVTQIAADGFTDFVEKSASFAAARSRPACAARNGQFIEVFGGLALNNLTKLSDWATYDLANDTLSPRTPSGATIPPTERPAVFSYGDGTNVLLIAGSEADTTPSVFRINCVTEVVTEITTTKPTGIQFFGDLIADDKIFIVAIRREISGDEADFWEYDTATHTFTELGVTGSIPALHLDYASGCYYKQNEFVLVNFQPGVSSSGKTYVFNRSTAQWTEINIAAPFGDTPDKQLPLTRFRMANVNGRPLLVGGLLSKDSDRTKAKIWELKTFEMNLITDERTNWQSWDATFPPVQDPGFCSSLGTDNLPNGKAAFFAGHGDFSNAKTKIYASLQGGLIATTFEGNPAITISDNSTFAQFILDDYEADWAVAGYLLSLVGNWNGSNLKVEVRFDDGDWVAVTPEKFLAISDSDAPGNRQLRITFYNLKTSKPILSKMIEVFDEDGVELEERLVVRYNSPTSGGAKALYIDRGGAVTISSTIEPSTPEKCLIHKVTPNGTSAPTLRNYINRRRPHIKYSKTANGTAPQGRFDNELAVPVRYVDARAYDATTKVIRKLADITVDFDAVVIVTEIGGAGVTSGDTWIVELEG